MYVSTIIQKKHKLKLKSQQIWKVKENVSIKADFLSSQKPLLAS